MRQPTFLRSFAVIATLLSAPFAMWAQATFTVVPANGQTVSASGPIVFTFSEAMVTDPSITTVDFFDATAFPPASLPVTMSWDAAGKVLTCTPNPAFPVGKFIAWSLQAETVSGNSVDSDLGGAFLTTSGGGGGGGGSGTNKVTTFSV